MSYVGVWIFIFIFVSLGLVIGWCVTHIRLEDREDNIRYQESLIEAKLKALGAANRLNVAFWRAKEELDAEVERHRGRGDRPW